MQSGTGRRESVVSLVAGGFGWVPVRLRSSTAREPVDSARGRLAASRRGPGNQPATLFAGLRHIKRSGDIISVMTT